MAKKKEFIVTLNIQYLCSPHQKKICEYTGKKSTEKNHSFCYSDMYVELQMYFITGFVSITTFICILEITMLQEKKDRSLNKKSKFT